MTLQRILYVEDETDIQQIVKLSLESVGRFTVQLASGLDEALATGPSFAPDLILLDYMLPEADGAAALQALRNEPALRDVPIVFVTARVQPHEIAGYRRLGALGVISKPFDPMTLPKHIGDLWQSAGSAAPAVRERLEAMRPAYEMELKSRMERLEGLRSDLRAFHREVHAVTGSAGTFGFHEVSRAAAALELHLKSILERNGDATPAEQEQGLALFEALKRAYAQAATDSRK
jgi:CheY-like chemotaxis protein